MTTMHFDIEDSLAEAAQRKARSEGKTLESWITEAMARNLAVTNAREWAKPYLDSTERLQGSSGGWKWNRDEIYNA